jgi:hypothetical protein
MTDANRTLSVNNELPDEARCMFINLTGTLTVSRDVICPAVSKLYFVHNATNQVVVFKTLLGTGVSIPVGSRIALYCNATNVVPAVDDLPAASKVAGIEIVTVSGTQTLTNKTINLTSNTLVATSAQIAAAVTDETGTGALVFANSPTLVAPALGTPASGVVTNLTGTASININGTVGATTASTGAFTNLAYTGTLTGGTGVINIGSGQLYKDASGNVGIGTSSPAAKLAVGPDNTFFGAAGYTSLLVADATNGAQIVMRGQSPKLVFDVTSSGNAEVYYDSGEYLIYSGIPSAAVERMRITAAGNVGIGTSSPSFVTGDGVHIQRVGSATLRVERTEATASAGEFFAGNDQVVIQSLTATAPIAFRTGGNPPTERLRITSAGNVGIGTSSPSYRTDIRGASTVLLNVEGTQTAGAAETAIRISQPATNLGANNEIRSGVTSGSAPYMSFAVRESVTPFASVERMRIDMAGNVGIGTNAPVGRLSVVGADNSTQAVFGGSTGTTGRGLRIATEQRGGTFNLDAILDAQATVGVAGNLVFQTQSIERMRIDSAGNVGIGTSSPGSGVNAGTLAVQTGQDVGISVYRNSTNPAQIHLLDNNNSAAIGTNGNSSLIFYNASRSTERMRIDPSGNLLIGKTTATANGGDLQVSSGITFPATQVAKSDANTLDDYEEGTWNSTTSTSNNNGTFVTADSMRYIKVGRMVTLTGRLGWSTATGGTGEIQINGLPFTVENQVVASLLYFNMLSGSGETWLGRIDANTSRIRVNRQDGASAAAVDASVLRDIASIYLNVTYVTNA